MRVKVGDTWYSPNDIPIMLELSDQDKENISNMLPEAGCYSAYPDGIFSIEAEVLVWMEADKKLKKWRAENE